MPPIAACHAIVVDPDDILAVSEILTPGRAAPREVPRVWRDWNRRAPSARNGLGEKSHGSRQTPADRTRPASSQIARSCEKIPLVNHTMKGQKSSISPGNDGRLIIIKP